MRFKFVLKQAACCGNKGGQMQLTSANYTIIPDNAYTSFIRAMDSFVTNYHTQPQEILVTSEEMVLLQQQLTGDFVINSGKLFLRSFPITVEN